MIRLSPTSISLSEADVDFHLRQAQLYHGLRKQGFKKDDIVRYLNDYRESAAQAVSQDAQAFHLSLPSTVELSCNPSQTSVVSSDSAQTEPTKQDSIHSSSTDSAGSSTTPFPDLPPSVLGGSTNRKNGVVDDDSAISPISTTPSMPVPQHAPRKSSLLRFAQAASPARQSPDHDDLVGPSETTPRVRKYRRRSVTYPYESSERESAGEAYTQDPVAEGINRLSLEDQGHDDELEDFSFALPAMYSTSSLASSVSDTQFASPPTGDGSDDVSVIPSFRPTLGRRRSSSLLGNAFSNADLPSSPPLPRTPVRHYPRPAQTSPESPQLPTTPTPVRNAVAAPRTEPRLYRQQLDGNSFSVYNDSLPSSSQPQTPADLSRQPLITEHDAAYTAPPGMIRSALTPVSSYTRRVGETDFGEQSPTARAITLRERRNRELTRSVRAEGVRLNRLRMRDEAVFTQRAFQTTTVAAGGVAAGNLGPLNDDVWRDDLDADRVGEENFEADPEQGGRRVMRAVSGNARFDV